MAKKKEKTKQPGEDAENPVLDSPPQVSQELNDNLLQQPDVIEQLRRLWAETNDDSTEPTQNDFRLMLEAISKLQITKDTRVPKESLDEWFDDDTILPSELFAPVADKDDQDPNQMDDTLDDDGIPIELLPNGYSEANELLSGFSPDLGSDAKLAVCLQATTICRQLVGAWILASSYAENDSTRLAYLRTAIEEAEWFYQASKNHPEYDLAFEDEYVAATLDATFQLWRLGLREEVLSAHEKIAERIATDVQGHLTIHGFRRYEQLQLEYSQQIIDALELVESCSMSALCLLKALHAYVADPRSQQANEYLERAAKANSHIIEIFLGDAYWHETYLTDFEQDSEEEAYWIASIGGVAIRSTEGFVRYMRNTLNYVPEPSDTPESDYKRQLQMLATLPLEPATWILESKQLSVSTYCTFVYDINLEELLCVEADEDKPTNARLWDILVQTMLDGQSQDPHRPSQLILTKRSLAQSWHARCAELSIDCEFDANASLPDEMMEGLLDVINKVDQDVQLTDENWEKAKSLPRTDETWHVGVFQPPIWISDTATPRKSCVALVIDQESEMIRIHDLTESRPTADYLSRTIMKGMFYPLSENMEPSRPTKIKIHPHTMLETVAIFNAILGIEIEHCDIEEESLLDSAVEHLILHCSDASMRESLFDCCEITESPLRIFYATIRDFYNAQTWKWIPSDRIIEISFPDHDHDPFYVCVIGQSGFHFGLVCSDDIDNLRAMSDYESDIDESDEGETDLHEADEADVTFLNFGESHEIPPIDLWFIEQFDFDVASEDAFPLVQRFVADQRYRRPNRRELDQIAVATKAIPKLRLTEIPDDGVTFDLDFFYHQTSVHVRWCGNS